MNKYQSLLICLLLFFSSSLSAQESIYQRYNIYRNPVRVFLNKISITATTGYTTTNYKHQLSGVYFLQNNENQYIIANQNENIGNTYISYTDWLNDPQLGPETSFDNPFDLPFDYLSNPVNNPALESDQFLINTDTTDFGFEGVHRGIPISIGLHYEYMKFRIGLGFTYEKQFSKELTPTSFVEQVRAYQPNYESASYTRFYGMLGYNFYQFWDYDFVAELQLGKLNAGPQFNAAAIQRNFYTNFGVSIENNWSEYFRVIVKPAVDFTNYTVSVPDGSSVKHTNPTFFLQVGVSINIPDIRRSPMKSDHVQVKHLYTDPRTGRLEEVRGQPIWKKQNPKVGQNHKKLWRYKWKNRKKLNSY
ncbi:MAG: hypothetical protein AB8B73_06670 [Ekhidna sp.]